MGNCATSNASKPMPLRLIATFLSFFLVLTGVMFSIHWYVGTRLIDTSGLSASHLHFLWNVLWVGLVFLLSAPIAQRVLPKSISKPLTWIGFTWLGSIGFLFSLTVVSDVLSLIQRMLPFDQAFMSAWRGGLLLAVAGVFLLYGFFISSRPKLVKVQVALKNLPKAFHGFRIVQLSDIHIGETLGAKFSSHLRDRVNALSCDAVVITGDMVDSSVERITQEVSHLGEMTSVHGTFFVTGNHEYYHGGEAWSAHATSIGMKVLHNQHVVLQRGTDSLALAGVTDVEGGRFSKAHAPDIALALEGKDPSTCVVLLAHQPRFAQRMKGHTVDLMLSGHTHGGQLWPFNYFVKLQQPVVKGLHTINGILTYTSQGTGYWGPPIRIGTRGEITELTLVCAS
jgi:uncharacterized protein